MELNDVINLSLYYGKKKGLKKFTPEEIISIGYDSYLLTEKLYKSECGTKKSTYFMKILEWSFIDEFRNASQVKIPKNAWNKGVRTSTIELNKKEYEASETINPNISFDDYKLLIKAYEKLPERHKLIIAHKYELHGKDKLTFRGIAQKMNLSPQRVRLIHLDALSKMKKTIKLENLRC